MENYIVIDIETTGLNPIEDAITEIGAIKVINNQIDSTYQQIINPKMEIPLYITNITGITNEMVFDAPSIERVIPDFLSFCGDYPIVGHNILFDYSFLKNNAKHNGYNFNKEGLDTLELAKRLLDREEVKSNSLESLCDYFNINRERSHRALDDAYATYQLLHIFKEKYYCESIRTFFIQKPLIWKVRKKQPITNKQRKYLGDLIIKHNIKTETPLDLLTKGEASRMIDNILREYGRR